MVLNDGASVFWLSVDAVRNQQRHHVELITPSDKLISWNSFGVITTCSPTLKLRMHAPLILHRFSLVLSIFTESWWLDVRVEHWVWFLFFCFYVWMLLLVLLMLWSCNSYLLSPVDWAFKHDILHCRTATPNISIQPSAFSILLPPHLIQPACSKEVAGKVLEVEILLKSYCERELISIAIHVILLRT